MKNITYAFLLLVLGVIILSYGKFLLIPLCCGALIAIVLDPLMIRLNKLLSSHTLRYFLSISLFCIVLLLPMYFITQTVTSVFSASDFTSKAESSINNIYVLLKDTVLFNQIPTERIDELIGLVIGSLQGILKYLLSDSVTAFSYIILSILFSYFLHLYFVNSKSIILKSMDKDSRSILKKVITTVPNNIQLYIIGLLKVVVIMTLLSSVLFWIIGVDYPLLWAGIIGFLVIIPYLGSVIGILLPIAFSIIQTGSIMQASYILIGYAVIQFLEGNYITPKIIGSEVGVNPFLIILCMLCMGSLWGIAGIIIAIPILVIIKSVLEAFEYKTLVKLLFQ